MDVYRGSWFDVVLVELGIDAGREALRAGGLEDLMVGVCDMGREPRVEEILGIFEGVDILLKAAVPFVGVDNLGVLPPEIGRAHV